ncbi:hypothetical protein NKR23_g12284 [Pleurostoma richardsiae]|uniref:NADH-ubiquinone oxidoreductase 17.8 kDa subunit n=1 Tax=Pleurostoma richardsiae TaxID=41990 RepID=A0AA38VFP6_9PEZI|nr:hypothetical protein NKR23_g12284 [Pleurostoma richardsiae]
MLALRQRAACIARNSRPASLRSRRYASGSHSHGEHSHHTPAVEEPLGAAFYVALAAIPTSIFVYSISRPAKDGELTSFTKFFNSFESLSKTWEERNIVRTAIFEQAAHDKHLLYNAGRNKHVELTYPEVFQTGSPYNVPAGHYINLEKVVDHYRQQHLDEETRKSQALTERRTE